MATAGVLRFLTRTDVLLALVILGGTALRVLPVATDSFPLGDGGLFATMANELAAAQFRLPEFTSYNGQQIPFAYPPIGLYMAAGVASLLDWSVVDVARLMPAVFSIATIPVVYAIARQILPGGYMAILAASLFAISPRSHDWLIVGGGITRSPGFLFALVTILLGLHMYRNPQPLRPFVVGGTLGITALTHPTAGIFASVTLLACLVFWAPAWRRAATSLAWALGTAAVVASPWLIWVVMVHGFEPLLSAGGSGRALIDGILLIASSRTSDGYAEVLGVATSIALIALVIQRRYLLPVWFIATLLADSRTGLTYASVPAALMVAALMDGVVHRIRTSTLSPSRSLGIAAVLVSALLIAAVIDSRVAALTPTSPLRATSADELAAMHWAATDTPNGSRFVVVTGRPWHLDHAAEWFPLVAARTSVGTVQGTEWLGRDQFRLRERQSAQLLQCARLTDVACFRDWVEQQGGVDYVLVTHSPYLAHHGHACCLELAARLVDEGRGQVVLHGGEVQVLKWLDGS